MPEASCDSRAPARPHARIAIAPFQCHAMTTRNIDPVRDQTPICLFHL
jgi:hypothetical protein